MRPSMRCVALVVPLVALLVLTGVTPVAPSESRGVSSPSTSLLPAASPPPTASPVSDSSAVQVAPAFLAPAGVSLVGPVSPQSTLTVEVGLGLAQPASLAGLVSAQYTPGTPEYRHFRTTSELASQFGPSESNLSVAAAFFDRFGLSVRTSPDHLLLTVSGTSAQVGAAFATSFDSYRAPDGRTFFSHPTIASLPPIAPWSGVYGLGNVTPMTPTTLGPVPTATRITPGASCTGATVGLIPCQIWQAYNMSSLIGSGTNGTGYRIALVDPYTADEGQSVLTQDLADFASQNSIGVGSVNYLYPVPSSGDLNQTNYLGWNVELALDLEWARAAAPGATIDMTFSPNPGVGLYEAVDWLVAHQAADVISMSWGEPDVGVFNAFRGPCTLACNASTDGSYGILSPVLEFAAAEGIGVFAASGDCGAADGTSGLSTNYPASDPYVTGVGGTNLTVQANGNWDSEQAWSGNSSGKVAPGCINQGGSGGGYSPFSRPTWQSQVLHGSGNRGVPDVALDAGNPVQVVVDGQLGAVGGTSVATPIWAGIAAVADQYAGRSVGLLTPSLYPIAVGANYSVDFHDVTSGSNGYDAGVGWDPVTGLGTPLVSYLVKDLAHPTAVTTSDLAAFAYATPRFGTAPLNVTVHLNLTGGTGSYPLEGVSWGDGLSSFASDAAARHTYTAPGVYLLQGYAEDSQANYSVSPPLAIVVGGGGALSVGLTASTTSPAVGASVTFGADVSGGLAPYTYNFSFGDGTFYGEVGLSSTAHVYGARGSFCAEVVVSDASAPVNGGASARLAIAVGGAPAPDCGNDSVPLVIHPGPAPGVRDAPADFPSLLSGFTVTGGSTAEGTLPATLQLAVNDPYVGACNCSILRSAGKYVVTAYANDSENQQVVATENVTVAPSLVGQFSASRTYGPAPLTVNFSATSSGGYQADAAQTHWTFGNGAQTYGDSVGTDYLSSGSYVAVAQLSDPGHGNTSEAFLIDVGTPGASPGSATYLVATVSPAVDVPLGTTVSFHAWLDGGSGPSAAANFSWRVGATSTADSPSFNWTYSPGTWLAANGTLVIQLAATDLATGDRTNATVWLPNFESVEPGGFVDRADAMALSDHGGPTEGIAPLLWSGSAGVTGPGTGSVAWRLPGGTVVPGTSVVATLGAGLQTVVVNAANSWGDRATDVMAVDVAAPIVVSVSLSTTSGSPPLTVRFVPSVAGGFGPPYRFNWSFGDGTGSEDENVTHTFLSDGLYRVVLNVTDPDGFSKLTNLTISVSPSPPVFPLWVVLVGAGAVGGVAALIAAVRRMRPGRAG